MASIYRNNGTYYISHTYKGKRITRSLKTKSYKVALELKPFFEIELITELTGINKVIKELEFPELADHFLKGNHAWAKATYNLNRYVLKSYIEGKALPSNPSSKATHIRRINQCWRWGLKNNLISKAHMLPGDTKGEARHRTFTKNELKLMFNHMEDSNFNLFVHFAYYTGARRGEIASLSIESVIEDSLVVRGKTGRRYIKLNQQAKDILNCQDSLWNYSKNYVSQHFKKEVRRLNIRNARFHDLRRTFGLNLIKQGMSIYKVSKLLGHKSVRTTERHYAPLLTVEIEDFVL